MGGSQFSGGPHAFTGYHAWNGGPNGGFATQNGGAFGGSRPWGPAFGNGAAQGLAPSNPSARPNRPGTIAGNGWSQNGFNHHNGFNHRHNRFNNNRGFGGYPYYDDDYGYGYGYDNCASGGVDCGYSYDAANCWVNQPLYDSRSGVVQWQPVNICVGGM